MGLEYLPIHGWLRFMVNVGKYTIPWEPKTFIFRGYNPYIGGLKPSFFMVLGSKGTWMLWDIQNPFRTLADSQLQSTQRSNRWFPSKKEAFCSPSFFQRLIILASSKKELLKANHSSKIKQLSLQFTIKNLCLSNNFASFCSSSLKFRIPPSSPPKKKRRKVHKPPYPNTKPPPPNGQQLVFAPPG